MPLAPFVANAAAQAMLNAFVTNLGASPIIRIYSGAAPADADAALSGNTVLAELAMSATPFPAATDLNPGARITANAISNDSSADATGTATFFRILTSGAVSKFQGTVGTATSDMILNTTAITLGSTVSITAATITLPEG